MRKHILPLFDGVRCIRKPRNNAHRIFVLLARIDELLMRYLVFPLCDCDTVVCHKRTCRERGKKDETNDKRTIGYRSHELPPFVISRPKGERDKTRPKNTRHVASTVRCVVYDSRRN